MLEPKKNPLIDQPLVAAPVRTFRRVRTAFWLLAGLIFLSLLVWLALLRSFGQDIQSEGWWRNMVSQAANWQFQKNLGLGHDNGLNEQLRTFETERVEMQATIQSLEKLVQSTRMDGWLRTFSARRVGNEEIDYEILIGNPRPGAGTLRGNIAITVRGIDLFDPQNPELALAQSTLRFRSMQHKIKAPLMAEAIKGRLASRASNFIIVTVIPFDDPALTEVSIIPIATSSRSP